MRGAWSSVKNSGRRIFRSVRTFAVQIHTMARITESPSRYDNLERMSTGDLLRNINAEDRTVDISRGTSRFANASLIKSYLGGVLRKLPVENWLRGLSPEAFVARLAYYMGEINATHPFREGNGRTQRVFCALLAEQAGYFIDFESVDQAQMYRVMIASFNGDAKPLEALLLNITSIIGGDGVNAEGMADD